jgi:hypothetical protein
MAALQYAHVPGYSAILFRRSYADLARPGALIDRAHAWLRGTPARWNEQKKTWRFPSGAVLTFGYLENASDVYAYQGAEFQFCGFDELTQFDESSYRYLFSRMRRLKGADVPVRMRAASNPGGIGHQWVFNRFFIEGEGQGRVFVPAKLEDNPYLDAEEYEASLAELDPVTRAQLRNGDWSAIDRGNAIVPEFTPELRAQVVKVAELPQHFTAYAALDVGSRDLSVGLLGHYSFEEARLKVEREVVLKDPSTAQLGAALAAAEKAAWGDKPGLERVLRFSDVDWRLVKDLREGHGLKFVPTEKADKLAAHNRARSFLAQGRIHINPSCKVLLATLEGATWNAKRTDYARTEETGHADAWDALVYLVRNVRWKHNPDPPGEEAHPLADPNALAAPKSRNARALEAVFKNPLGRKK